MASKKYRTMGDALALPSGTYIRDLTERDLKERLATLTPVVWKRAHNLKKAGLDKITNIPEYHYKGKTHKELQHIYNNIRTWLLERKTSTVRGARQVAEQTMRHLGLDPKSYKNVDPTYVGKVFEEFHKLQNLRPDWFVGNYSEDYLITIVEEVKSRPNMDITDIYNMMVDINRKEQEYNAKVYGDEDISDIFLR